MSNSSHSSSSSSTPTWSFSSSLTNQVLLVLGAAAVYNGLRFAINHYYSARRPSVPSYPSSASARFALNPITIEHVRNELARLREAEKRRLDITLHKQSAQDVSLQELISMYEDLAKLIQQVPAEEVSHDERLYLLALANRGSGNAYRLLSSYTRNQAFSYLESAASLMHDSISELKAHEEAAGEHRDPSIEVKRLQERAALFNDIGKLYSESAQFIKAREAYMEALNLHNALNSTSNHTNTEAFTTLSLGRLSQAEGKVEEAEQFFESSYQCYKRDFSEPHFLVPLLELLEMYLSVHLTEKAQNMKQRLLQDHAEHADTLNRLEKKYPKALGYIKKI